MLYVSRPELYLQLHAAFWTRRPHQVSIPHKPKSLELALGTILSMHRQQQMWLTQDSHVDGENLKVELTMAKALGGKGDAGKTNPEELFAAGYGEHSTLMSIQT